MSEWIYTGWALLIIALTVFYGGRLMRDLAYKNYIESPFVTAMNFVGFWVLFIFLVAKAVSIA